MNPTEILTLQINGHSVSVAARTSVAAALRIADRASAAGTASMGIARRSVSGEMRAPFCGMGICQECRVTIDGQRRLACQTHCETGMVVEYTS